MSTLNTFHIPMLFEALVKERGKRKPIVIAVSDVCAVRIRDVTTSTFELVMQACGIDYFYDGKSYYRAFTPKGKPILSLSSLTSDLQEGPFFNLHQQLDFKETLCAKHDINQCALQNRDRITAYLTESLHLDSGRYSEWQDDNREAVRSLLRNKAKTLVICNGKVYQKTNLPYYACLTGGMGNNHGRTRLVVLTEPNESIHAQNTFSAFELEKAVAYTTQVARARGDTDSLPIEVPESQAITLHLQHAAS